MNIALELNQSGLQAGEGGGAGGGGGISQMQMAKLENGLKALQAEMETMRQGQQQLASGLAQILSRLPGGGPQEIPSWTAGA